MEKPDLRSEYKEEAKGWEQTLGSVRRVCDEVCQEFVRDHPDHSVDLSGYCRAFHLVADHLMLSHGD
jgi:hypothetical protein